jgi:DNA-binding Lrp family transcriptional regulator
MHLTQDATSGSTDRVAKYFNAQRRTINVEIQMPTAFVLINTEIGSEADVLKDLKKVEGVEEANAVYGVYDIIARVRADTMDRLKEIVTWKVRRLDKVRSTLTMIVVEEGAKQ